MEVQLKGSRGKTPAAPPTPKPGSGSTLTRRQVQAILGERQARELRIARRFTACRGLGPQQLEDLYQETVLALLHRPYHDEMHLLGALRLGIKQRALNLYHAERRREEILAENAPELHAIELARAHEATPEQIALARQDRLLITEFLAELTGDELQVFELVADGMGYNRIAKTLRKPVNETRNVVAACERKRERFQLLHDSGRLCGYRSTTIRALLDGHATSEQLAQLAIAHVAGCAQCRAEHKTNAKRLRRAFQQQAAALLPPTFAVHFGGLGRPGLHARTLAGRVRPDWLAFAVDGARERAAALIAGGGASAKLAAGVLTAAVIAGSTIAATHALAHPHTRAHEHARAQPAAGEHLAEAGMLSQAPLAPLTAFTAYRTPGARAPRHLRAPGHVVAIPHPAYHNSTRETREPGGFAYLGVPDTSTPTSTASAPPPPPATPAATQTGAPFTP
jgi:DNA-directed RNA polymerase specialized sigma24 family protein